MIPGHGKPFTDVKKSIDTAKSRLDYLSGNAERNARHGAKVLLKYKLLEWCSKEMSVVKSWIAGTPALECIRRQMNLCSEDFEEWLIQALVKPKAVAIENDRLINLD
ncbi:hypothetical protein [Polynucleobacter necessarius]|uniref:hypothetical protein n=1 Tax=Polynucleobacter necessarius TaxID=576610 RepID=UPI001E48A750|nr:hypothetical protein [Polynucleobacter necessarius]